jgi:hypothetical protein
MARKRSAALLEGYFERKAPVEAVYFVTKTAFLRYIVLQSNRFPLRGACSYHLSVQVVRSAALNPDCPVVILPQ